VSEPKQERVVENLNRALHEVFAEDPHVFFIGEDVLDPYGGAFRVSHGLSTKFPDRVLTTPISEAAIVGFAGGLSLMGNKPIVEIMFGDFVTLAYDQIVNFISKSVTMYGEPYELNCVVRVPIGGGRGYGPTHSQSLQKHFIGIPNLDLYELSPFHDNAEIFRRITNVGRPCLFFEDKVLYTRDMFRDGRVDDLFSFEYLDQDRIYALGLAYDHRILNGAQAMQFLTALKNTLEGERPSTSLSNPVAERKKKRRHRTYRPGGFPRQCQRNTDGGWRGFSTSRDSMRQSRRSSALTS
jgi:pyruvate/2-oxoglutarate/acetoin dehydrogenase E1 component